MPKRSVASLAIATLVAALLLAACGDDSATAPAGSPLGRVAFVRDGDLWVADLDGADEKKLVDADSLDLGEVPSPKPIPGSKYIPYIERPEWSADGEWLSFAVPRHVDGPSGGLGAWFRVFVVRPDGTDLMEPWSEAIREFGPGFYGVRDWKWSPIGAELATAVFGAPPGVFYIRVFDPAKQSDAWPFVPQILTSGFEWLPGGGQIAVNFGGDPFDPSPVRNYRLVLYERTASSGTPYTGQEEPVYEYQGPFTYPRLHTVAPDSSRILLWDSSESGPPVQPLSAVSLDGSGAKTHIIDTYHVADWAAVWSPDSTAIAVIQGGERMGWRGRRLVVAKPDGGRLLDNSSEGMSDTNPAWSPDGARIAFVRAPERPQNTGLAEGHIWITPREGPAAQITDDPAYTERFPQWTPDGSAILFVRLPADAVEQEKVTPELWAMSPNGGNQRRVLELGEMPGATAGMEDDWGYLFDWKPEGEKPLPTGSVPSTPLASPTQSPQVPELRQGEPAEFPGDMAMIIETGCWGCSGGPGTLIRFYRNSSGQVQQETLLSADRLNLPTHPLDTPDGPREYPAWINGLAMEPTASIIAVSFCIRGYCGPGGESAWSADSLAVIFES
ncbi:MAG TPA: hypothetical protein VLS25_01300, partial [Dehalococcoidia bacterium]|nr:hypothetical protein [Dehalococcoidia bacterium]